MASGCNRLIGRVSLSSIKSAFKSNGIRPSAIRSQVTHSSPSSLPSRSSASQLRRFSISRVPYELGCVQSMLPLHSAVAAARMTSCLSTNSRSCRALLQGTLCCTCPSL